MSMVGGILKKVRNSGELSSITAQIVYENDEFNYYIDADGEHISHRPNMFGDRGKRIGAYALAKTKDGAIYVEVMTEKLKQLLEWFDNYEITFNEIRLSPCQYIFDLRKFISVQTNSVRRNWENPTFEYDIISLYQLKKVLEEKENMP